MLILYHGPIVTVNSFHAIACGSTWRKPRGDGRKKKSLAHQLATSPEFNTLCSHVLRYRLEKKQDCCIALRQINTWNVSGWRTLQWTNPKAKAVLRYARKGIVCLQETRWTASTATNFLQTYPGFTVAHSPANETDRRGLSGGVAIIIPCTFRLLQEKEILPGKAIAAQVQTRTDQFWILAIYCHPQTARADCKANCPLAARQLYEWWSLLSPWRFQPRRYALPGHSAAHHWVYTGRGHHRRPTHLLGP